MRTTHKLIIGLAILAASVTGMQAGRVYFEPPVRMPDWDNWRPGATELVNYIDGLGNDWISIGRGGYIPVENIRRITIPPQFQNWLVINLSDMPNLNQVKVSDGQQFRELSVPHYFNKLIVSADIDNNGFIYKKTPFLWGGAFLKPEHVTVPPARQVIGKTPDENVRYRKDYGLFVLEIRPKHKPRPKPIPRITIRHAEGGRGFVLDWNVDDSKWSPIQSTHKLSKEDNWSTWGNPRDWKNKALDFGDGDSQGFYRLATHMPLKVVEEEVAPIPIVIIDNPMIEIPKTN